MNVVSKFASLAAMLVSAVSIPPIVSAVAAERTAYEFKIKSIDGSEIDFAAWRGKALLIVNTASFCGFTRQYEGLQSLWSKYESHGLVVVGVPSNDFSQEPKGEKDIKAFCEGAFGVTFPLTEKVSVRGEAAHPLYKWLAEVAGQPNWNFHKYLVGRDGRVVRAFSTRMTPESEELVGWIEKTLKTQQSFRDATQD